MEKGNLKSNFVSAIKTEKRTYDDYKRLNPKSNLLLIGHGCFRNLLNAFKSDALSYEEIVEEMKDEIKKSSINNAEKESFTKFLDAIHELFREYRMEYPAQQISI